MTIDLYLHFVEIPVAKKHTLLYYWYMLCFDWNDEKNEWLQQERGVTFPQVIHRLMGGGLLDIIEHSNPERYPNQRIIIVAIDDYAYIVPFIATNEGFFLKTIFPSRKMTKRYL